jgi:APA family basic amino acid/polyamine antiporter
MYLLTNQAYLYSMGIDQMRNSVLVASDALETSIGKKGGAFIALLVMISTLGAVNGNILPCARVTYAMGNYRHFFSWAGKVHPRFHTPGNALWLHAVWSSLFVMTGTFDMLTDLFVFVTWIFYGFTGVGVFLLRRKMPDVKRPYKTWGYPLLPALFVAFTVFYFFMTIYNDVNAYITGKAAVINSLLGLVLLATGLPVYWYLRRNKTLQQA